MTLAPQSASWRTQVGPDRTRVRSSTVKRASAFEARGNGIAGAYAVFSLTECFLGPADAGKARTSLISRLLSTGSEAIRPSFWRAGDG